MIFHKYTNQIIQGNRFLFPCVTFIQDICFHQIRIRMKSVITFIIIFVLISTNLKSQELFWENGIAFSKLNTRNVENANLDLYPNGITTYQTSMGINYFQHKYYYLSSALGYLEKGGKYPSRYNNRQELLPSEKFLVQYLTLNTLFCLKMDIRKEHYYIGVGPRLDIRLNDKIVFDTKSENTSIIEEWPDAKTIVAGLKCEIGFNLNPYKNWIIGLKASYLPSFNVTRSSHYDLKLKDQTFNLSLILGIDLNTH